jgi:centrosomal protein CEP120
MAKLPVNLATEEDSVQQKAILRELADIESKVIWELENWKRAEEARFRFNLKQKESEHVERMRAEWKQKEIDRERVRPKITQVFKETENKMAGHMQKMQSKVNQLSKRENRLILLEEELKQKIGETSRQLAQKDEEVEEQKVKTIEEKKVLQKKVKDLEEKNKKLEEIVKSLEEDLRLYKIEQEKSPIEIVKKELNEKVIEIAQLRKEIEKTEEIKEEYRKHFDRLKDEVIKLKRERDQAIIEANTKHDKEINLLRNQLAQIGTVNQQGNTFNSLREELWRIKGGTGGADIKMASEGNTAGAHAYMHPSTIPRDQFGTGIIPLPAGMGYNEPRFTANSVPERQTDQSGAYKDASNFSNIRRLMNERAMLLKQGYLENDPLVQQIDETIKQLKAN